MGQRANLILVEGGDYRLFYSHWCADSLPCDLFWGPEHAAAFIRIQRAVDDDSGWLDDVWAEGGALVDLDKRHFLLYGGCQNVLNDVPLRRIYLDLLAKVWKGWTVRWLHEGIADLADYVGYPRERVLSKQDSNPTDCEPIYPEQKDWTDLVVSVRFEDRAIRLFPLAGDVPTYLCSGEKFVDNLRPDDGLPRLLLDEWTSEFPIGGVHLDLPERRLEFWIAPDAPHILSRVASVWPGWDTHWHHDHYERQLERTEGLLRFPLPDPQTLVKRCREMLLRERGSDPVEGIRVFANHEQIQDKDVRVNPWALRNDRLELPIEERREILDEFSLNV